MKKALLMSIPNMWIFPPYLRIPSNKTFIDSCKVKIKSQKGISQYNNDKNNDQETTEDVDFCVSDDDDDHDAYKIINMLFLASLYQKRLHKLSLNIVLSEIRYDPSGIKLLERETRLHHISMDNPLEWASDKTRCM